VTAWRRRRFRHENSFTRAVYEAHDYRPAMRRFFATSRQHPDILIDVDLPEGAVVLDVGAFEGEWTTRILDRSAREGPARLRIEAFEPAPSAHRRLNEVLGDDPRVTLHRFGLGGRDRDEVMMIAGPGTSLYTAPSGPGPLGKATVPIRDVHSVLTSLGIERIDLLKVNIEGGEFELIDRLHETGWLGRTATLIVQFHEFAPDAYRARRRNRRQLAETHRCRWSYPWVYERWDLR
jgi:FkbM family methyltransferase